MKTRNIRHSECLNTATQNDDFDFFLLGLWIILLIKMSLYREFTVLGIRFSHSDTGQLAGNGRYEIGCHHGRPSSSPDVTKSLASKHRAPDLFQIG